jgi:hypothetical protein
VLCVNNIIERRQCFVVDILTVVLNTRLQPTTTTTTTTTIIIVVFIFLFFLLLTTLTINLQEKKENGKKAFGCRCFTTTITFLLTSILRFFSSRANVSDTCLYSKALVDISFSSVNYYYQSS